MPNKLLNKRPGIQNSSQKSKIKLKNNIKISNIRESEKANSKKSFINDSPEVKISEKKINKNTSKSHKKEKPINDYELNTLEYESAFKLDKRAYIQYYWSLCK